MREFTDFEVNLGVSRDAREGIGQLTGSREINLSGDSQWSTQLAALRTENSNLLKAEIESLPGRVRRLMRPQTAKDIAANAIVDAGDVAETETVIELVGICRTYASELAVSEMTQRADSEVPH